VLACSLLEAWSGTQATGSNDDQRKPIE